MPILSFTKLKLGEIVEMDVKTENNGEGLYLLFEVNLKDGKKTNFGTRLYDTEKIHPPTTRFTIKLPEVNVTKTRSKSIRSWISLKFIGREWTKTETEQDN